jgi:enoyl-[acyl-carrier protein] reductase I
MGSSTAKRILVAGVTMDSSIGFADGQGRAGAGRHRADLELRPRAGITKRIAKRLPTEPPVLELDVTDPSTWPAAGRRP